MFYEDIRTEQDLSHISICSLSFLYNSKFISVATSLETFSCNVFGASVTNIERISKLQKRAARIILRANYDTPSVDMFSQLGWLSIPDRLKYNKAVLTYRAINNLSPEYITQLLKPVSEVHTLNLRSSENGSLYVPKARTALFDGSFSCSAQRLWNALPQTVKTSGSLSTFKQSLKATF